MIRPVLESDLNALYDLESDAMLKQYVGGPVSDSREVWMKKAIEIPNMNFTFSLVHKSTGVFAGRVTLGHYQSQECREIQLLLAREFVGKGLGPDACRLACAHAFDVMGATCVVGVVDPNHMASLQLVEHLGFLEIEPHRNSHEFVVKRVFALYKAPNYSSKPTC